MLSQTTLRLNRLVSKQINSQKNDLKKVSLNLTIISDIYKIFFYCVYAWLSTAKLSKHKRYSSLCCILYYFQLLCSSSRFNSFSLGRQSRLLRLTYRALHFHSSSSCRQMFACNLHTLLRGMCTTARKSHMTNWFFRKTPICSERSMSRTSGCYRNCPLRHFFDSRDVQTSVQVT